LFFEINGIGRGVCKKINSFQFLEEGGGGNAMVASFWLIVIVRLQGLKLEENVSF